MNYHSGLNPEQEPLEAPQEPVETAVLRDISCDFIGACPWPISWRWILAIPFTIFASYLLLSFLALFGNFICEKKPDIIGDLKQAPGIPLSWLSTMFMEIFTPIVLTWMALWIMPRWHRFLAIAIGGGIALFNAILLLSNIGYHSDSDSERVELLMGLNLFFGLYSSYYFYRLVCYKIALSKAFK